MIKRLNKQAKIVNGVMSKADNSLWKCDPNEYVFNQTYVEITRLVQVSEIEYSRLGIGSKNTVELFAAVRLSFGC